MDKVKEIKSKLLDMCLKAGTGHVSSSFSCTELMVVLYHRIMEHDPTNPKWKERDRFILSKAQASPLLYTILADLGYFNKAWLDTFAKEKFGVHLQNDIPGVEISAGSLGLGLGISCGMAVAMKQDFNKNKVYCLLGDAECYEGSIWEAAMFAAHKKLGNLVAIIDRNWMGATDWTESTCELGSLEWKWKAFGWQVEKIDGHNVAEIYVALKKQRAHDKPTMIIANTVKGNGCPVMEGEPLYHSRVPNCNECKEPKRCVF